CAREGYGRYYAMDYW
nr:immunoglobulin heavy chain junction region [Mus musculus]